MDGRTLGILGGGEGARMVRDFVLDNLCDCVDTYVLLRAELQIQITLAAHALGVRTVIYDPGKLAW
jgi:hypothetical protein